MALRKQLVAATVVAGLLLSTAGLALAYNGQARLSAHPDASKALVNVGKTSLGKVLTGAASHTLYHRTTENTGAITCTGGCLTFWPPLLLLKGMKAPTGSKAVVDKLGTISRKDISATAKQVTYDGWPLYYWKNDTKAGQVTGQGVGKFTVAPPAPKVSFHINITNIGVQWGTVKITGTYHKTKISYSCSKPACNYGIHAGVSLKLTQTATDQTTWPFQGWTIKSADGGVNRSPTGSTVTVKSNDNYTVTATYTPAA